MQNRKKFSKEKAEKLDSKKDYLDISSIFGNAPALYIVKTIFNTPLTPIHVTIISLIAGIVGCIYIYYGGWINLIIGAILLQVKNILDAADGSLARARNTPSRIGRFLDSFVDFIVGLASFIAIGLNITRENESLYVWPLVFAAFLFSMFQCSYYVYYNIQYITFSKPEYTSRTDESFIEDDKYAYTEKHKQYILICLQTMFLVIYGWQDKLAKIVDHISLRIHKCRCGNMLDGKIVPEWYNRKDLLKLNSVLGLGTQLFLLSFMAVINQLYLYLWIVVVLGNAYLLWLVLIRIYNNKWEVRG